MATALVHGSDIRRDVKRQDASANKFNKQSWRTEQTEEYTEFRNAEKLKQNQRQLCSSQPDPCETFKSAVVIEPIHTSRTPVKTNGRHISKLFLRLLTSPDKYPASGMGTDTAGIPAHSL